MTEVWNYFRGFQPNKRITNSKNNLFIEGVTKIFKHLNGLEEYKDSLAFLVILDTDFRPTELHLLKLQQLNYENIWVQL